MPGHVLDVTEAQVAEGAREVLPLEREHRPTPDYGTQELAVLKRILPNAGSCKTIQLIFTTL